MSAPSPHNQSTTHIFSCLTKLEKLECLNHLGSNSRPNCSELGTEQRDKYQYAKIRQSLPNLPKNESPFSDQYINSFTVGSETIV